MSKERRLLEDWNNIQGLFLQTQPQQQQQSALHNAQLFPGSSSRVGVIRLTESEAADVDGIGDADIFEEVKY